YHLPRDLPKWHCCEPSLTSRAEPRGTNERPSASQVAETGNAGDRGGSSDAKRRSNARGLTPGQFRKLPCPVVPIREDASEIAIGTCQSLTLGQVFWLRTIRSRSPSHRISPAVASKANALDRSAPVHHSGASAADLNRLPIATTFIQRRSGLRSRPGARG